MNNQINNAISTLEARLTKYNAITNIGILVLSAIIIPLAFMDITETKNYLLILVASLALFVYRMYQHIKALEQLITLFQYARSQKENAAAFKDSQES